MGSFEFDGVRVAWRDGDTVGSALHRAGVRILTRSIKYHRPRGLYCLSGDCANCVVTVDGRPGQRACSTPARDGIVVVRSGGWPSVEHDVLRAADRLHPLLPVGFYYKAFIRPRSAWRWAERAIRRATGIGRLPEGGVRSPTPTRHVRCDVLVVGAGVAGLAAARAAARRGERVMLCDEGGIGDRVGDPVTRDRIAELRADLPDAVDVLERHLAVGVYDGPLVPLVGPGELVRVEPERVVVATGAVEIHPVFPGNDLPGVFLGRGAARLAGVHGVPPGRAVVVVTTTTEGVGHVATIREAGSVVAAVAAPRELLGMLPADVPAVEDGVVVVAHGSSRTMGVTLEAAGRRHRIACDALAVSLGFAPRDALLRMSLDLAVLGAGDVVDPGCSLEAAVRSGAAAGLGEGEAPRRSDAAAPLRDGIVCPCEDVGVGDLERAWEEGWRSTEILKRYTTATMGLCQGALCGRHLAAFVASKGGRAAVRTTTRPPARPVRLGDLAGGVHEVAEKRTGLHERHVAAGATFTRSGGWMRPLTYGDVEDEYRAVRERASVMDVGTLGKFLIAGPDAVELVDRVFPSRVRDLVPGRSRYLVALDEAGYVWDDGLLSALPGGRFFLTTTSGNADRMEAWLRDWIDRFGLRASVVDHTAILGAINVAGPAAARLLRGLTDDDPAAIASPGHAEIRVADVRCRAIRTGFVGAWSVELHHPRSRGGELWDALTTAGAAAGLRPHGLEALDVLRLERGHLYVGQDTLPDDHPFKLNLGFAVAMDKGPFLGRPALRRLLALPPERRLIGLTFDRHPGRGMPLHAEDRLVGRVTSCVWSPSLGRAIGLGWVRAVDGAIPSRLRAGDSQATVVRPPFTDVPGVRTGA